MEPYAIITPDRSDRPKMLQFCKEQVSKFTIKPSKHYIIDYLPSKDTVDIADRLELGIEMAKSDGIDVVFVIESDDFYPTQYISRFGSFEGKSFWGTEYSIYYNIKTRHWQYIHHDKRSSLYSTGFRISALSDFNFYKCKDTPFVDIALWEHAKWKAFRHESKFILNSGAIGIKGHGEGMSGGKGHIMNLKNHDKEMIWLQSNTTPEAFEFYKKFQA